MDKPEFKPYRLPAGGWGSALSVGNILRREGVLASGPIALSRHNKVDGYQCNSCAWVKPASPLPFEYCENGVKAVAWELTAHRCTPDFFATHTVTELLDWDDYHLEQTGRLTHPLRYDPATDKYVPVSWGHAVEEIARELRAVPDRQKGTVFYSSGRLSNEASYLYQLFARLYGNNNLPDSSNMCHETTSVALPVSIGQAVGSVSLDDFAHSDCIMFFGQNPGSNAPRMLHPLQEASRRGVPIITYNPLRERGLERFLNPQSPTEMLTGKATRISSQYHQVKAGAISPPSRASARRSSPCTTRPGPGAATPFSTRPSSTTTPTASTPSPPGCALRTGTSWSAAPACTGPTWNRPPTSTATRRRPSASTAWGSPSTGPGSRPSRCW